MKHIHIGHHFFGSGNLGDDFMLAGFLLGLKNNHYKLTCCVPYDLNPLKTRFPQITWLPYDKMSRLAAIAESDVWLGLGGSPFQINASNWFVNHLKEETEFCSKFNKPMFYLGIGGQDKEAYTHPDIEHVIHSAKAIWTRDQLTYEYLKKQSIPTTALQCGSDLSHLYFKNTTYSGKKSNNLGICLNFDYIKWPNFTSVINELSQSSEFSSRNWLVQESRPLPEAEHTLYETLSPSERNNWEFTPLYADRPVPFLSTQPHWSIPEYLLSSRFHAAIANAWGGSKVVILEINLKLRSIAEALRLPCLSLSTSNSKIVKTLLEAEPTPKDLLLSHAHLAEQSVTEFISSI